MNVRAFVSVVLLALLLAAHAVPGVGLGAARAATYPCSSNSAGGGGSCTREEAYASCIASRDDFKATYSGTWATEPRCALIAKTSDGSAGYYDCQGKKTTTPTYCNSIAYYKWGVQCPPPSVWNDLTNTCFDPQECLARNADLGSAGGEPRPSLTQSRCVAGCEFKMQTSGPLYSVTSWQGQSLYRGVMEYTGNACSANPPTVPDGQEAEQPNIPPQECISVAGQNVCVKPNGDQCYSGPIGRPMQFCWRPGETGNKSSGDVNQARAAGSTAPSAPTPPVGDSFQSADPPMTTNTSTGSGVVINTTVQNYTTVNGANAGPVNQGELPDGTGAPGSAGGTGSDSSSASGGGDCQGAPIVSDPALAMIATQAWATRCAVEAGNAAKVTGDVANCTQPFTVEGSNANAVKLRAMRAEICKDDANGNGQPDWTEGDAPGVPGEGDPEVGDPPGPPSEVGVSTGLLDMSGIVGGAATCPALGTLDFGEFGTFDLNSESVWCDLVDVMRAVVLLMAAFAAIKILMGGK